MAGKAHARLGEKTLVELRSTGKQTMVPPSVHPVDGDRCFWYPGETCEIEGEQFATLVQDVAVATLLAINFPLGSRQHFAIHVSGYLVPRVGLERSAAILEAASVAFDDEEHDQRMLVVRSFLQGRVGDDPAIDTVLAAELERGGLKHLLRAPCSGRPYPVEETGG